MFLLTKPKIEGKIGNHKENNQKGAKKSRCQPKLSNYGAKKKKDGGSETARKIFSGS